MSVEILIVTRTLLYCIVNFYAIYFRQILHIKDAKKINCLVTIDRYVDFMLPGLKQLIVNTSYFNPNLSLCSSPMLADFPS